MSRHTGQGARTRAAQAIEIEWQFQAADLDRVSSWLDRASVDGVRVDAGELREQHDTYLDTRDWRFYRAGVSLRVRRVAGRAEVTLKSLGGHASDTRVRTERTGAVAFRAGARAEAAAARAGEGVGQRVRAVAGARKLRRLFDVRTIRQVYRIEHASAVAELALDRTRISPAGRRGAIDLARVEVEIAQPGDVNAIAPFVEAMRTACGLSAAHDSKYELGLRAARLQPGAALELGEPADAAEIRRSSRLGRLAFAILREHFSALVEAEPGTRLGDDPEALHRMRVAARRLRVAMSLFKRALPEPFLARGDDVRWVGRALADARDIDVLIGVLADAGPVRGAPEGLARLLDALAADRAKAGARVLRTLNSARYERMLSALARMLRRGPPETDAAVAPATPRVEKMIRRRSKQLRRMGRDIDAASSVVEWHALRIASKKLRYTLEFSAPVRLSPARKVIARLTRLQDALGELQDARSAIARLAELRSRLDDADAQHAADWMIARLDAASCAVAERAPGRLARLRAQLRPAARKR